LKNWVAEGVASEVNDFCVHHVPDQFCVPINF
jgi:hypothetical protein